MVPNAPCGVESDFVDFVFATYSLQFLMHRVELKALRAGLNTSTGEGKFLMHRVELKVGLCVYQTHTSLRFLMHRVELKVISTS